MSLTDKQQAGLAIALVGAIGVAITIAVSNSNNSSTMGNNNLAFQDYYKGADQAAFLAKVQTIADQLGINPNWLMFIMWNETAHTFSPTIQPTQLPFNSEYPVGLIQFEPPTAQQLGTTTTALSQMTALQQLDYVQKYFQQAIQAHGLPYTLQDAYLLVFYPAAKGQDATFQFPTDVVSENPEFFKGTAGTLADFDNAVAGLIPASQQQYFS